MADVIVDGHQFSSSDAWERIKDGPLTELAYVCDDLSRATSGPTGFSYARLANEIRTLIQLRHGADRMSERRTDKASREGS